jgi:pyridoxal biosynthesis lyase PdxS
MKNHTPTPYTNESNLIYAEDKVLFAVTHKDYAKSNNPTANAEFIVKACNNHYQLLEALKSLIEDLDGEMLTTGINDSIQKAKEAIKQAEG